MKKQRGGFVTFRFDASCFLLVLLFVSLCLRTEAVALMKTPEVIIATEHSIPTDDLRLDPNPNLPGLRVLISNAGIQSASASIQKLVATSFVDTTLPDVVSFLLR